MGLWERLTGLSGASSASAAAPPVWTLHLFGKVPSQPDFLRLALPQGEDEALLGLERWVTRTIEETTKEIAPRWSTLVTDASPITHLHRVPIEGGGRALVAAVSLPSGDAVGRSFPVVACARLHDDLFADAPHLAPIAIASFVREVLPTLREARSLPAAEIRRRVAAVRLAPLPTTTELTPAYDQWLQATTLGRCALQLFGADVGEVARALAAIDGAVSALRGQELASTRAALRCPVAVDPFYAAFWLDCVRRLARWKTAVPTFIACGDDASGALIVALGDEGAPPLLADAWMGAAPSRPYVSDVAIAPGDGELLRPELRAVLAAPDATLDRLLAALTEH